MPRGAPESSGAPRDSWWRAREAGPLPMRASVERDLTPGQRHELAAVLGERILDRLRAVEDGAVTVRELDGGLAPADQRAQDPAVTVDRQIALDVDDALEIEIAVDAEIAVHVEHALAVAAVIGEVTRLVAGDGIVVEIEDAVGRVRLGGLRGADPAEELRRAHPEHVPGTGIELAGIAGRVVRDAVLRGRPRGADAAGAPSAGKVADAGLVVAAGRAPLGARRGRAQVVVAAHVAIAREVDGHARAERGMDV